MHWRLSAAYVLVLLALLVGGCGGGSSARPAQSGEAGAAAELHFIAQADAICKRVLTQIGKHVLTPSAQQELANTTLTEVARIAPYRVAAESQGVRDLSRLHPPAKLAIQWHQMLGYMHALALELDRVGSAAQAKDRKALKALVPSKTRLHAQLRAVAKRAGFSACRQV